MAKSSSETPGKQSRAGAWRVFGIPLRGISFRFVSFVLVAVLLAGAGVAAVVLTTSRNYLRQQALNNNLNQVNLAAAFASNYIKAVEAHLLVFASRPDIRQAVLNGTAGQLQPTLTQFVQIQTALDSAGIYNAGGILQASSFINATTIGQSFADREWYQQTIALNEPYFGIPTQSRTTGSFTVPYVVPIKDDQGQIRGLLIGGISLGVFSKTIANVDYGLDTTATIIDMRNGGMVIADQNPQLILTPLTEKDQAISMLQAGKSGALEIANASGAKNLTGFAPVPGLPWGIIVVTPSSAALSIINTLTQRASIFAALVVLVTVALGIVLVIGITRPLNRLVQETKEIGSGNLEIKVETGGKDEVGELSHAFSDMTTKLKTTMVSRDDLALEVSVRQQAEEKLRNQYSILKSIIESPNTPIFSIDKNYCYTTFNSIHAGVMKSIYGVDIEIGKSLLDYMRVQADRQSAQLNLDRVLNGEKITDEAFSGEETLKRSYFIVNHSPVRDIDGNVIGALVFAQDVTKSKQAEEKLRETNEYLENLFNYANAPIIVWDNQFTIVRFNHAFEVLTGRTTGDVVGQPIDILFPPAMKESSMKLIKVATTGERWETVEISILRQDGALRDVLWNSASVFASDGKTRLATIAQGQNITVRKQLALEKEKFIKELSEKNTELERFTYTVSHDLKSPLVTIKTFLGYLKQDISGTDAQRVEKDMVFMNSAADKMEKLLGELLEMSRIGRVVNLPVEVTFKELVHETLSIVAGNISDRDVQVKVNDGDIALFGDRSRLLEIWQNLVENAIKFMGDQPSPQINIGIEHRENETVFFVRDNGIGIDPKFQPKLFNLFEKINPKSEGTGMGLAIAKRIVELYGGRIWVESEGSGHGSTFFFTLPGALQNRGKGA